MIKDDCRRMWRFIGFYGNLNDSMRLFSWDFLRQLRGIEHVLWVCVGDFNEIVNLSEEGGGIHSVLTMVNFRMALAYCGLMDISFMGHVMT